MCGIIGQVTSFSKEVDTKEKEVFSRLITMMARRGPDDAGLWSDEERCILGFRRLTILDLSPAGHQPMLTLDGRYAIVYNGEVYNFRQLRKELELKGVRFRSTGDTEVVLYALTHWGTRALYRFEGMFALGFYDKFEKRLLLARDHAGIKPLYYMLTQKGLVFASQYDQILSHPWSQGLKVSASALALYMHLGYIPAPYALLEETHMLEPGTWLEMTSDNQTKSGRFFEFPVFRDPDLRGQDAYEAVDEAVSMAVRGHLVSDVPLGTFLSGGIDSPLVAAKMQAMNNGTVRAFTMGTNGDFLDESSDAEAYARDIGVEHYVEHMTPDRALNMLHDVIAACSEPFADYSMFPTLFVSQMARRKVKVMLSGDGGDELFWGYAGRFASVMEKTIGLAQPLGNQGKHWNIKKLFDVAAQSEDPRWPTNLGDCYRLKHTHLPEGWLRRIVPDLAFWPSDFKLFDYTGWEPQHTAQWLRWNEFMGFLGMVLLKVDRASMYHSLEVRVPLLDKKVIEVATRIEWTSCLELERKVGKLPLRYALARHVNHQTWSKRGFTVPMETWLKGPLRPVFEEVVLGRKDILGFPIDKNALSDMFYRHISGEARYDMGLWILLSLFLWEEKHYRDRCNYSDSWEKGTMSTY